MKTREDGSTVEDEDATDDFDDQDSDEYFEDETWDQAARHIHRRISRHREHDKFMWYVLVVAIIASSAAGFIIDYLLLRRITKGGTSEDMQKQILGFLLSMLSEKMQNNVAVPAPVKNENENQPDFLSKEVSNIDTGVTNKLNDTAVHETWLVRRDMYGKVTGSKKTNEYVK